MINKMNIDNQLIEDILWFKFNRFLSQPKDITLISTRVNADGDIIGIIKIHNSVNEIMDDMLIPISEYTNLLRQKKLKEIGID